jgi:hypothetical protein
MMYDSAPESNLVMHKTTTHRVGLPGPPMPQAASYSGGLSGGASANRGGPTPPARPIEIRKEFPETFIFDNLEFDSR